MTNSYDYILERDYERFSDDQTRQMLDEEEEQQRLELVLAKVTRCTCCTDEDVALLKRNFRLL